MTIDIDALKQDKRPQSSTIVHALIDRLEAAEKEIALKERVIDALGSELNAAANARDALRAKIAEMERQEPVAFALYSGGTFKAAYRKEHEACDQRDRRQLSADLGGSLEAYRVVPHYALPGALSAPSVPDGFAWPECPKRRQSHVLFDDGYEEGWAACVATIKAALAAPEAKT